MTGEKYVRIRNEAFILARHIHRHVTLRHIEKAILGTRKPFAPKGLTFSGWR